MEYIQLLAIASSNQSSSNWGNISSADKIYQLTSKRIKTYAWSQQAAVMTLARTHSPQKLNFDNFVCKIQKVFYISIGID